MLLHGTGFFQLTCLPAIKHRGKKSGRISTSLTFETKFDIHLKSFLMYQDRSAMNITTISVTDEISGSSQDACVILQFDPFEYPIRSETTVKEAEK